ncbi:MAG: hypothetical protein D6760_13125, partial [Deltaproteobacteria bacterium]
VKVRPDKGWIRFSLVSSRVELGPVATQASLSASVILGQPADHDACYSAVALKCKQVGIKSVCR